MSDDAKDWRWVGEDGAQKTLSEQELIAELSSESLPNYTLVWRRGWAEWLPAMQVAELAWALPPGKADDAASPKERAGASSPPVPPLYRYPVIKRRAQNLKPDRPPPERPRSSAPKPSRSVPPSSPSAAGKHAAAAPGKSDPSSSVEPATRTASEPVEGAPAPGPSTEARLGELDSDALDPREFESEPVATEPTHLAPANAEADELDAVDPDEEIVEVEAELDESRPDATAGHGDDAHAAAYAYGDEDNAETRVLGSRGPEGGPTYVAPHAPPPAGSPSEFPRLPPPPAAPSDVLDYAQEPGRQRRRLYAYALAMGGLIVLALALVLGGGEQEPRVIEGQATPAGSVASAEPPSSAVAKTARPIVECGITREPVRLAESAHPGIMPSFAQVPQSSRVAVGFGDGHVAYGITVDPRTLDRDEVFRQKGRSRVVATAPTTDGSKLSFTVVRDGQKLSPATVINAEPAFLIGWHDGHLARRTVEGAGAEPTVLWREVGEVITTPRAMSMPGTGYAVTLRSGDKRGRIRVGWLTSEGSKLSELGVVKTAAELVGTPDIGTNAGGARIAFAARKPGDENWQIQTARVQRGGEAAPAAWFTVPPGGPGDSLISPIIAGLPGEHWLLAWTEGRAGSREVRVQALGDDGAAAGDAVRVSPAEQNAGQGAIYATGPDAMVLFFVEGSEHHELWGTAVSCTPQSN